MVDRIASSCQPIRASARRAWRLGALVMLAAIAVPARGDVTPVEILALGQQVEPVGSLSSFGDTLCLAADGRVAVGVSAVGGQHALVCGDATGFSAIVREGDPSPRGGVFVDFTDCALPGDGGVYFAAMRNAGQDGALIEDVYRATPQGIEWIVGAGAVANDGTRLLSLAALNGSNVRGWPVFEANDRGTVLVRARVSNATVLVRVRMLGVPEALRARRSTGQPWIYGNRDDAALAGDDTVIALAMLPSDEPGIVALDGEQVRVLFTLADILADIPVVDGALNFSLYSIEARGQLFSFRIEYFTVHDGRSEWYRQYVLHTPARGFAPFVDPALYDDIWIADFTPTGRALIVGIIDRPYPNYTENVVVDESGLTLISRDLGRPWGFPDALALNDRGNVLLQTRTTPDSDVRRSLALTGPAPDPETRCFIPPTALQPTGTATDTPSPTPSATPSVTPTARTDCDAQPEACAHLRVHSLRGAPGERVTLAVSLDSGPWTLAGLKGDLRVPQSAPLATGASGEPVCHINPAIDKSDSRFAFRPVTCTENCTQVRAVVLAFDNIDPITSNATVFECDLIIRADAPPGDYPLTLELVEAANTDGHATPIDGIGGTLEVQAVSNQAASNAVDGAGAGGSGCHVGPARQHGVWPTVLLAVIAMAARRLRAIRHRHRRRMMAIVNSW